MQTIHRQLKQSAVFSGLNQGELDQLIGCARRHSFLAGQVIVRAGEAGDEFHIILVGQVGYLTSDVNGAEVKLGTGGAGDCFGEVALLTGQARTVRVRAESDVETLSLDRTSFEKFLSSHPGVSLQLLKVLGERLYQTDTLLVQSFSQKVPKTELALTAGQKIADRFAATMGSWGFILVQSLLLLAWVGLNLAGGNQLWDPYPFILLNLVLSFQSAYAAPIIMMSQNRQTLKDRIEAEVDHEVNLRAEMKTSVLLSRLDDLDKSVQGLHQQMLGQPGGSGTS